MTTERGRQRPQQQASLRGARDNRVICRGCGERFHFLGRHLRDKHGMNIAEYRNRFGANLPAVSASRRKALSKGGKKYFADVRNRLARRGEKRGELSDWDLAVRFSAGKSGAEIAREFHRDDSGIERRGNQLGFSGTNCPHYFGQRADSEFARELKARSGLSAGELEVAIGAKKGALTALLYPHGGRQRNTPELAADLIAWLDKRLSALLKTDFRGKPNSFPGHKSALIPTLVPNFHPNSWLLLKALKRCRKFVLDNPKAGIDDLSKYVCDEARFEVESRIRQKVFAPFLKWASQLDHLMKRDFERLRGTERLEWLACDWIASPWSTGRGIVYTALRRHGPRIPANNVAGLIRLFELNFQTALPQPAIPAGQGNQNHPGRRSNRNLLERARTLHSPERPWWKVSVMVEYPGFTNDPHEAGERLRQAVQLMEKRDRNKLNSPDRSSVNSRLGNSAQS